MRWYLDNLVCPRDRSRLSDRGSSLECAHAHRYPVIEGVPIMLVTDVAPTIDIAGASAAAVAGDPWQLSTLSLSDEERAGIARLAQQPGAIDPVVAYLVAATNGLMYKHLVGQLAEYPLPDLPLPDGAGRRLVDVGCSWGRWTLAAAARGYDAVGIDPSLGAVLAATRVARQLGRPAHFVVGDARHLPFPDGSADTVYSYSVLQHLSRADAASAVGEIARVLRAGGLAKLQFPTRLGIRCLYHQARRGFREPAGFEVRYWSWAQLRRLLGVIGPARFEVDCYFGIGLQKSDARLMTPALSRIVGASEWLKALSRHVTPLQRVADSVFVESRKTCVASPVS